MSFKVVAHRHTPSVKIGPKAWQWVNVMSDSTLFGDSVGTSDSNGSNRRKLRALDAGQGAFVDRSSVCSFGECARTTLRPLKSVPREWSRVVDSLRSY